MGTRTLDAENHAVFQTKDFAALEKLSVFPMVMQSIFGTKRAAYLEATFAVRRLRPRVRRRARTFFPFTVFMRARNPCLRRLLVRLGCNVLFINSSGEVMLLTNAGSYCQG